MRDFTIKVYIELIRALKNAEYGFHTFSEVLKSAPAVPYVILRHDVDAKPKNSLEFAQIQHNESVKGSYFFRAVSSSWDEEIIRQIHDLGHEIGYHYENLSMTSGDMKKAIEDFEKNLESLRKICPVSSICMHGSPTSRIDPKLLWKYYDYADFDIVGEPYFDLDLSEMFYLTDTGRRWDGQHVSIRDKVSLQGKEKDYVTWNRKPVDGSSMNLSDQGIALQNSRRYKSTFDLLQAIHQHTFPDSTMLTFHPQRWSDKTITWAKELVWQNFKNIAKRFIIRYYSSSIK